ncbi:MAG: carboxypeptidase regulatory-like domain-containing protein [Acidobacteriota bacterium]
MATLRTLEWRLVAATVAGLGLTAAATIGVASAADGGLRPQADAQSATVAVEAGQEGARFETIDVQNGPPPDGVAPAFVFGGAPTKPMAAGTGLIFGQTKEGGSSRPLAGALVTLRVPGVTPLRVLSDGEGRFVFRHLPPGSFLLEAAKPGYADGASGRMRPSGSTQPVVLGDGERLSGVHLALWKFAAVTGTVVDETGEPMIGRTVRVLRRAFVSGAARLTLGPLDQTDDRGIYRIGMLEPGEYVVCVPAVANRADLMAASLQDMATRMPDTNAAMRIGVIGAGSGGAAQSEASGPVAAFSANALMIVDGAPPAEDMAAGRSDDRPLTYPTVCSPTTGAGATAISLAAGDERAAIDFQLRPSATAHVTGTVTGPTGPAANLAVTLLPAQTEDVVSPLDVATTRTDAAGRFEFSAVAAGAYFLRAIRAPSVGMNTTISMSVDNGRMTVQRMAFVDARSAAALPSEPTLWADAPVAVGIDDLNILVPLRTGATVSGQTEWMGAAARPAPESLSRITVTLEPVDARTAAITSVLPGRVDTAGTFSTAGAPPGRYVIRVGGVPDGWFLRDATVGGRDATNAPLTVDADDVAGVSLTFTDKQIVLSGTVTDSGGERDGTAAVVVFPAERELWANTRAIGRRLRYVRASATGEYSVQGLPAGQYLVAAVADAVTANWQDRAFLESVSSNAIAMTLTEGTTLTQPLKVSR